MTSKRSVAWSKAAHADLGKARLAAGEIGLAVESYRRALELDPDDGQVSDLLARLEGEMGDRG
ncbi:MAG: tetratricopeptide repeat protein [Gemmatimonadetes bacterium]|nr:tetratricopeptide repeat protein [Gemmatimonadota bacterium]